MTCELRYGCDSFTTPPPPACPSFKLPFPATQPAAPQSPSVLLPFPATRPAAPQIQPAVLRQPPQIQPAVLRRPTPQSQPGVLQPPHWLLQLKTGGTAQDPSDQITTLASFAAPHEALAAANIFMSQNMPPSPRGYAGESTAVLWIAMGDPPILSCVWVGYAQQGWEQTSCSIPGAAQPSIPFYQLPTP